MVSMPCHWRQMLGFALAIIGFIGIIVVCALPMWKDYSYSYAVHGCTWSGSWGAIWEGMWMKCVEQSTGQMQCKVYDSMLALYQDLQAARAMIIISILTGIFAVIMSVAGGKCTNCIEDKRSKAKACIAAGVLFIISGLLCLIPVSWSAHTTIRNFDNPLLTRAQRRELGAAIYIGWAAAGLLLMGGSLLCWNCPPKDDHPHYVKFTPVRSGPALTKILPQAIYFLMPPAAAAMVP